MKAKHYLLLDDDEVNNFISEVYINDFAPGSRITAFTAPAEVLAFLEANRAIPENHPDYILIDLNMPVMNGWELIDEYETRKLQDDYPDTRLFILTSSNHPGDAARASFTPLVSGFFMKPIDENMLKKMC